MRLLKDNPLMIFTPLPPATSPALLPPAAPSTILWAGSTEEAGNVRWWNGGNEGELLARCDD